MTHSIVPRPGSGSRRAGRVFLLLAAVAALTVVVPAAVVQAATGDWTQFRESQTHQAHNTAETILSDTTVPSLGVAWTGATGGAVNSSPAIANGVAYVGSSDGKLYAFAVGCATGGGTCTPIWKATTGGAIDSSPAVVGNRVYIGSSDGKLYAYAVGCATGGATCTPVWTATTGGPIHSSPSVDNGVVYIGSNDGKLYAYAVGCATGGASCSPVWTATTGGSIESSPAVASGTVFVGSDDNKLYAFATGCATGGASCSPLWTATTGGDVYASPTVLTGVVYVGSLDGKLYSFDAAGITGCSGGVCTPIWQATTGGPIYSSPSTGDGRVWVGSDDGFLYTFRLTCGTGGATCTPQWVGNLGSPVRSSPASSNDVVYVAAGNGHLYAFDADLGVGGATEPPIWTTTIGTNIKSSAAVSNGVLYYGSDNGSLYAFHLVADHLVLTPSDSTVSLGAPQNYQAEAIGVGSVDLGDVTASTHFTIVTGTCTDNACESNLPGNMTVTGNYLGALGTATLHVTSTGATYVPVTPNRLVDSRPGASRTGLSASLTSGVPVSFQVTGRVLGDATKNVPANAVAITGNLTAVNEGSKGYFSLTPSKPVGIPSTSTLNFPIGDIRANAVTIPLGSGGTLWITFTGTAGKAADVVFDVTGYFLPDATGATYKTVTPNRLVDSRPGATQTGLAASLDSGIPISFQVTGRVPGDPTKNIPANAVAVTGNVTAVNEGSKGYLSLTPAQPAGIPSTSTVNFPTGDTRANAVTVPLGGSGVLWVTFTGTFGKKADVVFDVTGYFVPDLTGATYVPVVPNRLVDSRPGVTRTGLTASLSSGTPASFQVTGRLPADATKNIPASAIAITGNLTAVNEGSKGYFSLTPAQPVGIPSTSTINFPIGDTRANAVTLPLGGGGVLWITFTGTAGKQADAVFDVTGYFTAP